MKKKEFRNTTTYNRALNDRDHPYTLISNTLINDERLSFYEKGLMTWILSNSDKYVLNMNHAGDISGFGKTIRDKASKRLQKLGYLKNERVNGGWHWIVNEIPQEIQQGSNTNIKKPILKNEGSNDNVEKPSLINDPIISTEGISTKEINTKGITKKETSIEEINDYPNSANLNNNNCQPKGEDLDNKLNVVNGNDSDSVASSSLQKETESTDSGYDSINIQNEIEVFNPVYFKNSNGFVGDVYNEFVKKTDYNIPIHEFEKVLLLEIHNQYAITNPNDEDYSIEKLKQFLLIHTPTIIPINVQNTLKIMRNPKHSDTVINIIEKYNPQK